MKKVYSLLLSALILFIAIGLGQPAYAQDISIIIDGEILKTDQAPIIQNGRTLVPLRAIFEGLGAEVRWDNANRAITSSRGSSYISLTVDQTSAYINGTSTELDVPPTIINNRTLVPVRVVGESLGATVTWHNDTQSITIESNDSYVGASRIDFKRMLPTLTILPPDSIGTIYVEARFNNITPYPIIGYSLSYIDLSTSEKHYLSTYDTVLVNETSPKFKTFGPKSSKASDIQPQELDLVLKTPHGKFYVDYDYRLGEITQILKAS